MKKQKTPEWDKFELPPDMKAEFDRAEQLGSNFYEQSERSLLTHIEERLWGIYKMSYPDNTGYTPEFKGAALFIVTQAIKVLEPQLIQTNPAVKELVEAAKLQVQNFKRQNLDPGALYDDDHEAWTALESALKSFKEDEQ